MSIRRLVIAPLLFGCLGSALALDDTELGIVAAVDTGMADALTLLERSVNINSGTMNFAGVRAVGDLFQAELDALGFETEWIDGAPFDRAGHLVAHRDGNGRRLLLIGHLDTVFEPDSPFQQYEALSGNRAAGPGVTDMKGGNVVIVHALRALAATGVLDDLAVRVVLTGDEEKRGQPIDVAVAPLVAAAEWADIAIGFEDGDGDPTTAVISRRSSSSWSLTVSGKPAHSSQIFRDDMGYGAIFEAARIIDGFRTELADEANLTFNPGVIVGGTEVDLDVATARGTAFGKNNVIPETVRVEGDLRALSSEQLQMAREVMQRIVDDSLPHTSATIEFRDRYPPLAPTAGNRQLLTLYDQVSQELGFGPVAPVDPRRAGAADVSFTAGLVEMAIDGIGLMGEGGHTVDEVADLNTLPMQTKRAAVLMYRLSQGLTAPDQPEDEAAQALAPPGGMAVAAEVIRLSEPVERTPTHEVFGAKLDDKAPGMSLSELLAAEERHAGEVVRVTTRVSQVCQKKGCFFIATDGDATARVTMADYGFFVPTDVSGKEVTLVGTFDRKPLTAEQTAHYAADLGTEAPSEAPAFEYTIVATSVMVPVGRH